MFKSIIRNASWLFVAELANKAVLLFISIVIARLFGDEIYGRFGYALSLITLFSVMADFGINNYLIREIARDKTRASEFIGNGLVLKIFFSAFTVALIAITMYSIPSVSSGIQLFMWILVFYLIFNSYTTFSKSIYRSFEKMQYEACIKILESIILMVYFGMAYLVWRNVYVFVGGLAFASGISFFISLFWIKKFFTKFSIHIRKETISILLRHSWPFAIASIFVTAYFNIDTVMVKWIRGDEEAGWYSAAYNFIFAFSLIPSLMSSAFYPVLSRVHHDFITFRHKIHVYMLSISFVGLMLSALTVLFSKYIITLVYSVEYTNSVHSLRILACTLPFLFLSNFMGTVLASLNRQMIGTVIVGFSALFNIILNYVLISQSGQVGAAIASFFTFFLMCMALVVAYVFVMKYQMKPLENL